MYALDYSKKRRLLLSNDAFYFLYCGEEPLDESNLAEAEEARQLFPSGFEVAEGWEAKGNGLIEAEFIPYSEENNDMPQFDSCLDLTKYVRLLLKRLDGGKAEVWAYDSMKQERKRLGVFDLYVNEYGRECFQTGDYTKGKGSLFFTAEFKPIMEQA